MEDIYCDKIIPGSLKVDIVYETNNVLAFHHTKPYWEQHVVIIPKTHIESLSSYSNAPELDKELLETIQVVTKMFETKFGGCRISSNIGTYQTTKHLHWYVHFGKEINRNLNRQAD